MNKYKFFNFDSYEFDEAGKTLQLHYSLDEAIHFTESYRFDFDFTERLNDELLERAFTTLFYLAGVSYYKTYLPPHISLSNRAQLDQTGAEFLSKTYQRGLGEFFYVNKIDPRREIHFPANASTLTPVASSASEGLLIGIGGGKDSLVSVELLKSQPRVATWSVGHQTQLTPLVEKIGLTHFWVERTIDPKLLTLKDNAEAYNGHIPISAILAAVGTVVAVLSGYHDVVVSNESSANEPTLTYDGVAINHQYSKSLEFENDYQNYLLNTLGETVRYYSFLRPLSELHIAKLFAKVGYDKYAALFSSCNRAFTQHSDHIFWCGVCPKCAFTFLVLTPFVDRSKLEALFGGKNLLLDPVLEPTYRQLLGIEGDKPLECVGEIKESRAAMRLAQTQYPELEKYRFDIPADYDYLALAPHRMPRELYKVLQAAIRN